MSQSSNFAGSRWSSAGLNSRSGSLVVGSCWVGSGDGSVDLESWNLSCHLDFAYFGSSKIF
jgi:hypothetical protein